MKIRKRHERKNAAVQDAMYKSKTDRHRERHRNSCIQRPTIWMVIVTTIVSCILVNTLLVLAVLKFSSSSEISDADLRFITETHDPYIAEQNRTKSSFYRLANDSRYHYEFRYEFNVNKDSDDHRLMLLFNGRGRICADYWSFCVGRRIVSKLRDYGFSILAICAEERVFDIYSPMNGNEEIYWVYTTLQIWMNTVYYKRFERYPRLFTHGVSQGASFATMLSRILPIQAQILFATTGNYLALTTVSSYKKDMQLRMMFDPTFASWFTFDFCYSPKDKPVYSQSSCPLKSDRRQFYPVPPTFYMVPKADPFLPLSEYKRVAGFVRNNSIRLGGPLLKHNLSIQINIIYPRNLTPTYMLENFDVWHNKSYASRIFYEYMQEFKDLPKNKTGTCRCLPINFTYWDAFPEETAKWPLRRQAEHRDYVRDVKKFRGTFCEDICGDLQAYHAMSSLNLEKALDWCNKIDGIRRSITFEAYLNRPLRLWMYDKKSIGNNTKNFLTYKIDWSNIAKPYEMYSSEYHLQDYFYKLKTANKSAPHNLTWTTNPLLADYFIIPSDLIFFYFDTHPENFNQTQFEVVRTRLNDGYFDKLLKNIQSRYRYWTIVPKPDQAGSNHIIVLPEPRNIDLLNNKSQHTLKNVIKITFTGLKSKSFSLKSRYSDEFENIPVSFKPGYDIVIPQFTRVRLNFSQVGNWNMSLNEKKNWFHFADNINHASTLQTIHTRMVSLSKNIRNTAYDKTTKIHDRTLQTLVLTNTNTSEKDYITAVQSSIFSICAEDYIPWSACVYEAIQLGVIPIVLTDKTVLPFERFVDWSTFTLQVDAKKLSNIIDFLNKMPDFESTMKEKLKKIRTHVRTFRWPYAVPKQQKSPHMFLPMEDQGNSTKNAVHYLALELRCRRIEQVYGLTSNSRSKESVRAQRLVCKNHGKLCPCPVIEEEPATEKNEEVDDED